MKSFISLLFFILICANAVSQNQTVVQQPSYTQTEYELKLQQEKDSYEIQNLKNENQDLKEHIKENIQRQDKYIDNALAKIDNWLTFSAILIGFLSFVATGYSIFSTWKVNTSERNINEQLKRINEEAKKSKDEIETQLQICHDLIEEIKKAKKLGDECVDNIKFNSSELDKILLKISGSKENILDNDENRKESLEINKYVENLVKTKTESHYKDKDWAVRGLKAYRESKYDEAVIYLRKVSTGFDKYSVVLSMWGTALSEWAKINNDEKLFAESIEKFQNAAEINPKDERIFNNWGGTILSLAQLKKDLNSYKTEIDAILLNAEEIKEGSGSYNLACLYSLLDQKEVALTWLEKDLNHGPSQTKEHILSDSDLNNIKSGPRFKELLDRYYPNK